MESNINDYYIPSASFKEQVNLIKDVLRSGRSVELPASGYSMFPALKPGDRVIINPLSVGVMPKPGSIVIYEESGELIIHRLIKIHPEDPNNVLFVTRGDSRKLEDPPWSKQKLIGVATKFKHDNRDYTIRYSLPSGARYFLNLKSLWIYHKINRLKDIMTSRTSGKK